MLQARTSNHAFITLAHLTTAEIEEHREQNRFYCPICQEPVMIKAGIKVIPHFAHYAKTDCPSYRGGEGPYHERGKLLLYEWLKAQNIHVELEVYLKDIQRSEEHTSELQSRGHLVCRLLLEKKNNNLLLSI